MEDRLSGDRTLRVVDVEIKVCHDRQMIPVDRLLVSTSPLLGDYSLHGPDDAPCAGVALLTVFDPLAVGYHILDMTAVLGEDDRR